jgi:serine phosphatase RsbU (regulator of sigma subunit)
MTASPSTAEQPTATVSGLEEGAHEMACVEVWGGIRRSDRRVRTPGMDIHVFSEPYHGHEAGGDIHYVSTCGKGQITRLLLADVAGHGDWVAALAGKLRDLLKRHMHTIDNSDLARALNDEFAELAEGGRFATAIIASYFAPTDQLIVVNAGHPRPLWYRADKDAWRLLTGEMAEPETEAPENLPLGLIGGTNYRQFAVNLASDDRIVIYSDAMSEAAAPSGEQLGEQGLLEAAASAEPDDVKALTDRLVGAVARHRDRKAADDDATVLAVHHTRETPPPMTVRERLTGLAQMVGLAGVRTVEG